MFGFMFTVSLELFEHVHSFFGVGYTLRCRLCVLNYNCAAATRYVSNNPQRVASDPLPKKGPKLSKTNNINIMLLVLLSFGPFFVTCNVLGLVR